MKTTVRSFLTMLLLAVLAAACTASRVQEPAQYDLGPLPATVAQEPLPPLRIAHANAPAWLGGNSMVYRLNYVNRQQMQAYANSRWTMPPARLFEQRLKARLAQAGTVVLSAAEGTSDLPLLRIDVEDFSQAFDSAATCFAQVSVRVSVMHGRKLTAQTTVRQRVPARTADAAGGAAAMAQASDAAIDDIQRWLAGQPLK